MSTNTLTDRASGQTILADFFNSIHLALEGDFVGRDTSGVPAAGKNLGTVALPWGTTRTTTLILNGNTVDPAQITAPQNIVVSGKTRSTSNQPAYITPNGAALSFIVDGNPTNLVLDINGVAVAVSTDVTKSSLTGAPSTNNTALVNDLDAADQADTRLWGEYEHVKSIAIDTVGSEITALVGKWAAFKIVGVGTEYFLGYVKSGTEITNCYRGYFYDSSLLPIKRTEFSNNDTITLMKLGWVFVEDDATTVDVTYNNPAWDFVAPNSPASGDYWYDLGNSLWKRYDGAAWQIINRTFIGLIVNDTGACVAARCADFYAKYSPDNTLELEVSTTSIVSASQGYQRCNVAGQSFNFGVYKPSWNITTELATSADMYNASEQADTYYYLYLKDDGATVISDMEPYFRGDFFGWYHPHNPWLCVGDAYNDLSSDIVATGSSSNNFKSTLYVRGDNGHGSTNDKLKRFDAVETRIGTSCHYEDSSTLGAKFTLRWPGEYYMSYSDVFTASGVVSFTVNETEPTTAAILKGNFQEIITLTHTPGSGAVGTAHLVKKMKRGISLNAHDDGVSASVYDYHCVVQINKI